MPLEYLIPCETGLASNSKAICKKVAKLLDALSEINNHNTEGEMEDECHEFRFSIIRKLQYEGWRISVPKNKYVVKPPKDYLL